jgi:glutamyl-tRNA synthetase
MQSAPQLGVRETRYPGTCRGRYSSPEVARRQTGKPAGLRFVVPDRAVTIRDGFAPSLTCNVQQQIGDFLVARRDRMPAYQLAVVVDDAEQGVTEVLRGDDLLSSTARQWHLQEALGLEHPRWFHVPLVLDHAGRRLAKRADDLSLASLREQGTDPRAIVAWAARSAGQVAAGRATASEIVEQFELARLPSAPVRLTAHQIRQLVEAR